MPEVEELDDACVDHGFTITDNGFGHHHEYNFTNYSSYILNATSATTTTSSIINIAEFNSSITTPLATTVDSIADVLHNLTASVLSDTIPESTNSYHDDVTHTDTTSRILKSIIPYNFTSSSSSSSPPPPPPSSSPLSSYPSSSFSSSLSSPPTLISPSETTPLSPPFSEPSLLIPTYSENATLNESSPISPMTITLEYLLQNIANVTAEINSATTNLQRSATLSTDGDYAPAQIPQDYSTAFINDLSGGIQPQELKRHDANNYLDTQEKQVEALLTPSVETNTPSFANSVVSAYVNASTSFFDILNTSKTHLSDLGGTGYDSALKTVLETTSGSNVTATMATVPVDCSRTFILLRTELQKTQVSCDDNNLCA